MAKPRDFDVPDNISDVALLVDDKKFHVNKTFLATLSPMFDNMFMKDFKESKQTEVKLDGPPGTGLKYDQFLEMLKVIHPPHEEVKTSTYEYLLNLAHYFDIELVFRFVDKFLARDTIHTLVPLIKKVVAVDKYFDKLMETKVILPSDFKQYTVVRNMMVSAEYPTLSSDMKAMMFESVVAANKFFDEQKALSYNEFTCNNTNCKRANTVPKVATTAFCWGCGTQRTGIV